jgi:hypothetical protein
MKGLLAILMGVVLVSPLAASAQGFAGSVDATKYATFKAGTSVTLVNGKVETCPEFYKYVGTPECMIDRSLLR